MMSPSIGSARPALVRWRRIPGPPRDPIKARLLRLYIALERRYGATGLDSAAKRSWWPGRSSFEIAAGAIIVQFTAWRGAERAVQALRRESLLSPARLAAAPEADVERALRPAGGHRVKTRRLRAFTRWLLDRFDGRFAPMRRAPLAALRRELLAVHGIGPETADAILLYAAGRPVFVADEYARRVLERHRLIAPGAGYEARRAFVEAHLPSDPALLGEYHALLVAVGQEHCGPAPRCDGCPLRFDLKRAAGATASPARAGAPVTAGPRRGRPERDRRGAARRPGRPARAPGRPSP
jgi:endonuclease-3 related protein